MKKIWSKLKNIKKSRYLIMISALALVVVMIPHVTLAEGFFSITAIAENALLAPIQAVGLAIVAMLGALMQMVMYLFVAIAQYDGFANAPAISLGWSMIRDLCNMVIVVYLLYIAFEYALGLGHGDLDKSLVNLVLVAIGVNFSKTITLLLVDISQVVMLTFVNSFKNIGVAELYRIMNIGNFFNALSTPGAAIGNLATIFFTIIIMTVVLTVLALFMAILVVRIVMIWFQIILSPIFIAGYGVGWLKTYHDKWKKDMTEYLLIGPCLAFFIWLTFASMQNATGGKQLIPDPAKFEALNKTADAGKSLGEMGTVDKMTGLIVALALLMAGITICSKYASASAFPVGGFDKKLKDWSSAAMKFASTKLPADVARGASRRLGTAGSRLTEAGYGRLGKIVGGTGTLVGGTVKLGRGVSEFLKQPGTIAKGLYEQAVTGEAGAAESALTTSHEQNLKHARDEMSKKNYNVNALQQQWETAASGGFKDKTMPEIMALFEQANTKGAFKTPQEYMNALNKIADKGTTSNVPGMKAMTVQWRNEQKEKKFTKGSMHSYPDLKIGKDGKPKYNTEGSLDEVFEDSADRNKDNFWENVSNKDLDTSSVMGKDAVDKLGYLKADEKNGEVRTYTEDEFNSSFLQTQLSHIMGSDEKVLARSKGTKNKAKFNQNLGNLLEASMYTENGERKSRLTNDQIEKVKRLMAASLIDTDTADKESKREGGDLENLITEKLGGNIGIDQNLLRGVKGRELKKDEKGNDIYSEIADKPVQLLRSGPKAKGEGRPNRGGDILNITPEEISQAKSNSGDGAEEITDIKSQIASGASVDLSDSAYEAAADLIAQNAAKSGAVTQSAVESYELPEFASSFDAGRLKSLVQARLPQIQNFAQNQNTVKSVYQEQARAFDNIANQTTIAAADSFRSLAAILEQQAGTAGVDRVNGLADLKDAYMKAAEKVESGTASDLNNAINDLQDIVNKNTK